MLRICGESITLTRGDTAAIQPIPIVTATDEPYVFEDGDRVIFRLRKMPGLGEVFEKDCNIDVGENTAVLSLLPEDTAEMEMTTYRYEFELVTAMDEHYTFIADQQFTIGKELEEHG